MGELPDEVWRSIGEKLSVVVDQIRFRLVCKTWRSFPPFPQTPWLMLAQPQHYKDDDNDTPNSTPPRRSFFCLDLFSSSKTKNKNKNKEDGIPIPIPTPITRGFFPLDDSQAVHQFELPEAHNVRCLGSTGSWLITIDPDESMCLLNPFSRRQVHLPPQCKSKFRLGFDKSSSRLPARDACLQKVILSSSPLSSDCIAMAICTNKGRFILAFARPGGWCWTTLPTPQDYIHDVIFYKNQFYGINMCGLLMVCDLGDRVNPPKAIQLNDFFKPFSQKEMNYLVEWMGELLYVIKFMDYDNQSYKLNRFEVYVFDFIDKSWNELKNLGDYSLFLGLNTSVAVLTSRCPGLKRNCIYFTDDYSLGFVGLKIPGGRDMGVFDMEDGSIKLHYKGISTSLYSPPLWIIPSSISSIT